MKDRKGIREKASWIKILLLQLVVGIYSVNTVTPVFRGLCAGCLCAALAAAH